MGDVSSSAPLKLSNVDWRYFSLFTILSSDSELIESMDIGFLSVFSPLGVEASKDDYRLLIGDSLVFFRNNSLF